MSPNDTPQSTKPLQEPAHPLSATHLHFETGHPEDFKLVLHQHQNLELNYVLNGELTYFHCGRIHKLEEKQLGVFWASHPHVLTEVSPGTDMIWFHVPINAFLQWKLPSDFFECVLEGHILTDKQISPLVDDAKVQQWLLDCQSDNESLRRIICREMEARLQRMAPKAQKTAIDFLAADVTFPDHSRPHPKAVSMAAYMAENYREPLTLNDVAKQAGIHPAYASSIFRKSFNLPLSEFITRCRVAYAIGLLGNTNRTVIDIAFASGFGSISRFYEAFSKQTDRHPSDFR